MRTVPEADAAAGDLPPVRLYDTTLRDGAQRKGISFSLPDKLRITRLLDAFGIHYVEGGWPGSNPKDAAFFAEARQLGLRASRVTAFGSTCKVGAAAENDPQVLALLAAQTPVVAVVGKSWDLHVEHVLRTSSDENLRMIADTVRLLKREGREVVFDAEHFFDGYRADAAYARECLRVASEAGADWLVLCDTNGGSLPAWVRQAVTEVRALLPTPVGVHTHNDSELAVANALAAVAGGATQIQGTINGIGERCGNANLVSVIPALLLKMQRACVTPDKLARLTELSRSVDEIANLVPDVFRPYVGSAAFAHKGGIHVAAVEKLAASYEHIDPALVGNERQILVSELAGRGNVRLQAQSRGLDLNGRDAEVLKRIKDAEAAGLSLESADGTFELLVRRAQLDYQPPFRVLQCRVLTERQDEAQPLAQAVVKLDVHGTRELSVAEAQGPVEAIDLALRRALLPFYPALAGVRLTDYKVRILDPESTTAATTRVWIDAAWIELSWSTVGCSNNIIDASVQALLDSFEVFVFRYRERGQDHGSAERSRENLAQRPDQALA